MPIEKCMECGKEKEYFKEDVRKGSVVECECGSSILVDSFKYFTDEKGRPLFLVTFEQLAFPLHINGFTKEKDGAYRKYSATGKKQEIKISISKVNDNQTLDFEVEVENCSDYVKDSFLDTFKRRLEKVCKRLPEGEGNDDIREETNIELPTETAQDS